MTIILPIIKNLYRKLLDLVQLLIQVGFEVAIYSVFNLTKFQSIVSMINAVTFIYLFIILIVYLQESQACIIKRIEELKEEVTNLLKNANDHLQEMELIDALQRLGVAYHFEKEIDKILKQICNAQMEGDDLHTVALRFRLLRQHGYNIPASKNFSLLLFFFFYVYSYKMHNFYVDVFIKFKEVDGSFKAILRNYVKGLLSLYEATYLGIPEDDILDEALNFAKLHLKSIESHMRTPLAT